MLIDPTKLIAHRGESEDAPENTLPAYRMAVERGFGFECDVYLSKDLRVFTFHDPNLSRTTDGASDKPCAEATWDELRFLDVGGWGKWKGSAYVGTRPALLEEVLALARDGRRIYLEIKPGPEIVPHVRDIFAAQSRATPGNLLFISFNRDTCRALKELMPEFTVYWLSGNRHKLLPGKPALTAAEIIGALKETGADGVDFQFDPAIVTREMIEAVHASGHTFHVWTLDDLPSALEAFRRGVDTVTTNCAQRLCREAAAMESAAS